MIKLLYLLFKAFVLTTKQWLCHTIRKIVMNAKSFCIICVYKNGGKIAIILYVCMYVGMCIFQIIQLCFQIYWFYFLFYFLFDITSI